MGRPIGSILIAGGGVEGWWSALTLCKRLPGVAITLVADPLAASTPADLYAGTRPAIRKALPAIGLNEGALLRETGGVIRLGQRFEGWAIGRPAFFHGFGSFGAPIAGAPFHQAWLRADMDGKASSFEAHAPAAMLAQAGRVAAPTDDPYSPLATVRPAFNLDPSRLRAHLRAAALHGGVSEIAQPIVAIERAADDRIGGLRLGDGTAATADLFVDCSGPAARLLTALGGSVEGWARWLPNDRLIPADAPAMAAPPPYDRAIASADGWLLEAPLASRTIRVAVTTGEGEGAARSRLRAGAAREAVAMPQGRQRRPWIGNVVAVGESAVTLEPLGAPGLHLLVQTLKRLLTFMPDTDFDPIETAEYDRRVGVEADLVRDFVVLHHALARGSGLDDLPPSLAHTLRLFTARGKIPGRDGETAELDDWLAVLIGHGVRPVAIDALADAASAAAFAEDSHAIRALIAQAVAGSSTHAAFLRTMIS